MMPASRKTVLEIADELRIIATCIEDEHDLDPADLIAELRSLTRRLETLREDSGWNVIDMEQWRSN
jgi:hypothetical protein